MPEEQKKRKSAAERAAEKREQARRDLLTSLKRTVVPMVVGAVAATGVGPYIDLEALALVLGSGISVVYYAVVRLAEEKAPAAGILLGAGHKPSYK